MKGIAVMINIHRVGKSLMAPIVHSFWYLEFSRTGSFRRKQKIRCLMKWKYDTTKREEGYYLWMVITGVEIKSWKELFSPVIYQGLNCTDEHIWKTVTSGRYLLILNDVENFGPIDEFSETLYRENRNKIRIISKCVLEREYLETRWEITWGPIG